MSGVNAHIGRSVLNACLISLDNTSDIILYVIDTADTSLEKFSLPGRFENLKAIIGPVFANEIKQYSTLFFNTPILSLSNNPRINCDHVFACGLSLQDEIRTLISDAILRNISGFLVMLPEGKFGDQVLAVLSDELKQHGIDDGDGLEVIRYASISRKAATKYAENSEKEAIFIVNPILDMAKMDGKRVLTLSSAALANEEAWSGVIFAYADSEEQREFIRRYVEVFGVRPSTIAMAGRDAVETIKDVVNHGKNLLNEEERSGCFGRFSISKKHGFRRELQIFQIRNGGKELVELPE
jgi:hypothetical protein